MSTTKTETVHLTVSIAPCTKEVVKPDVGFKVIKTEKMVVETRIIIALSEKAFDYIANSPGHEWVAPNGLMLKAHSQYATQFLVDGDRQLFYMNAETFRGKRFDISSMKFSGDQHLAVNADKVGDALKALAAAVANVQPEVPIFDGLDVF